MSPTRHLLFATILAVPVGLSAQGSESPAVEVLELDRAVAMALDSNRQLKIAALDVERAQQRTAEARSKRLPTFSTYVLESQLITSLDFTNREREILSQVTAGDVPDFLGKLCMVSVTNVIAGKTNFATFYVAPDYLAVGSDDDYFFTPMTPVTAQRIGQQLRVDTTVVGHQYADAFLSYATFWLHDTSKSQPACMPKSGLGSGLWLASDGTCSCTSGEVWAEGELQAAVNSCILVLNE